MDDQRIWEFEASLWKADPEHYRESVDDHCLMVIPTPPFVLQGAEAIRAVSHTPHWSDVQFSKKHVARPEDGLIVIAYAVTASKAGEAPYQANCTSTYRRLAHDNWRVVQHQQTPHILAS